MRFFFLILLTSLFFSCIGEDVVDDYVAPQIRLTNPISSIEEGTTYQFEFQFFNNIGQAEAVDANWSSEDPSIVSISATGLASALQVGTTNLSVTYQDEFGESATDALSVEVGESTVVVETMSKSGAIATTSSYDLEGDFTLTELPNGQLDLSFGDNYVADSGLPGLYVYLSNNPNSTSDALEIAAVQTFQGAHNYIIDGATLNDYSHVLYFCKPFNVKVGDGEIE
ncbi:DM13 domain-containing protein [Neolewinella agarilytica]|uniref:Electron transfer DM13 n=1 Tax=Neolewinella agarilytica TaxID=478744 RepID=A0A1H9L0S1_9BACT|nr:DM13 domain-containing protein [Neolewinella agarilytica]SER04727.1 Electron transfer DM13 [Neolewinella agarilytica]